MRSMVVSRRDLLLALDTLAADRSVARVTPRRPRERRRGGKLIAVPVTENGVESAVMTASLPAPPETMPAITSPAAER